MQFYAADGRHVRTLKVPGRSISCCEWEAGGLRVALAVDSFVYFANIRPDYMWCYFKRTVVYARAPDTVTFWDTSNDQSHARHVPRLLSLAACGEHCVLATDEADGGTATTGGGRYGLLLCNTLGVPVDGVYTDVQPLHAAMNNSHAIVASRDHVLLWRYVTPRGGAGGGGSTSGRCRVYHADDTPSGAADVMEELGEVSRLGTATGEMDSRPTVDPICCVTCTEEWLIVGRESGALQQYVLPRVALIRKHRAAARPHRLAINCDGTKCAVLDASGQLTSVKLTDTTDTEQDERPLERKDVWAMCWAADDPKLLAVMEKTRMYVLRGAYPEEPIATSGYVCCFSELDITCVLLDELASGNGATPRADQHLVRLECKSLRDTRQLLDKVGVSEAAQFVEDNPHPRLWRLLGQAAVERRDLPAAERAFVRSLDYPAVRFVKRLREVRGDERLVAPLVAAHLGKYDEAERAFLECDRRDLALALRRTLGDWFRVVQLTKAGGGNATDSQLEAAWSAIGLYFYHRQNWEGAREYLKKSRDRRTLAECLYRLEEYEALEELARGGEQDGELLGRVARMLVSVGRGSAAAAACLRAGDLRATVELCARQGRWEEAVALARQGELQQLLPELVRGQAAHVAARDGRPHRAVLLLARAGRSADAARALLKLADAEPLVRLYIHAALLAERDDTCPELASRAWRSAAAHHLLGIAHAHLYAGRAREALVTALRVADMEDALSDEKTTRALYCLLALAACLDRSFAVCSRAFIRLESLADGEQYKELAVSVFARHGVQDREQERTTTAECYNCRTPVPDWANNCSVCFTDFPTCMVTGRPLQDSARVFTCTVCRHCCHPSRISLIDTCPLCHAAIQP